MVACVWPGRMPEVNTVRASPIPTGASAEYLLSPWGSSKDVADYGPYTANASLWQISVLTMYPTPPPQPAEIALRSRRAIAHFECELDILINDPTSLRFRP
jgi:hypothetical protein